MTPLTLKAILFAAVGGMLGTVARLLLSTWITQRFNPSGFPWGTFAVNMIGCLLIGFLAGLLQHQAWFKPEWRCAVFAGLLGGFTTYSSFAFETISLAQNGHWITSLANVFLQLALGLLSVIAGLSLARWFQGQW